MRDQRDELDDALDTALASYGEAPENEGLERRILVRVTEKARRTHPTRHLAMAIGATVAAVIACLFWVVASKTAIQTLPANKTMIALKDIEPPRISTIPVPEPAAVPASAANPGRIRKKPAEPKLLRFPTPVPLTSEERALIQLVTRVAKSSPRELTYLGRPVEPIHITAVEIKPLRLGWNTKEKRCCDQ